jgi:hypothetical protein
MCRYSTGQEISKRNHVTLKGYVMTRNTPIGTDPEVFLWDRKSKEFVSAAGFFPGTKKEPYKVNKGAIQVDGVALEFNIDPAESEDEFFDNVKTVHQQMEKMVQEVNPNWEIKHTPYATFSKKLWDTVPEEARELGCDPDFTSPEGVVSPNPTDRILAAAKRGGYGAIRTASGHIHIGFADKKVDPGDAMHFEDCRFVADSFRMKSIFHPRIDEECTRLSFYGGIGAFRPKPYGVELRSPSNYWLRSEQAIRGVYKSTLNHFKKIEAGQV